MNKTGLKDPGNIEDAAGYAEKCRTGMANSHHMKPPSGPKKEPNLTNNVPMLPEKGVSKN